MKKIITVLISLTLLIQACGLQKTATNITAKIVTKGMSAVESENDLWIAHETILPLVKVLEVLNEGDPGNWRFLTVMAQVYGNVAFGFFEPRYMQARGEEKKIWLGRIDRYYKKGYECGLKALRKRLGAGIDGSVAEFEKTVKKAGKNDKALLFWTAFDLGNYINLHKDDVSTIINVPKVEAMVSRVVELDPDFGYGAALAFKAAMLASRPKMLGGNPEAAKGMFEEAVSVDDGKYLMNKVMYAEWYANPRHENELSVTLLNEVIDTNPDIFPEQALANLLAKERAELLIKMK